MDNIKLYEVDAKYVNYLTAFAPHLFHNKAAGQSNERKYIGVILTVNGMDYFAPLSSFKSKHAKMPEAVDFIDCCTCLSYPDRHCGVTLPF